MMRRERFGTTEAAARESVALWCLLSLPPSLVTGSYLMMKAYSGYGVEATVEAVIMRAAFALLALLVPVVLGVWGWSGASAPALQRVLVLGVMGQFYMCMICSF